MSTDPRATDDDRDLEDWRMRGWMLWKLQSALRRLCARALVLEVHCAFAEPQINGDKDLADEVFLHRRFGLHGKVREFVGHRMQLDVSDQGDMNHHQISLFCSQPQDLPTPSVAHFRMLQEILDTLQGENRVSLRVAYRHSRAGIKFRRKDWDPRGPSQTGSSDEDRVDARAALLHLFAPETSSSNCRLAGSMGKVHAISQRLRASFSLVRSAFSVGSLSRMENVVPDRMHQPPFEVYRSWLRGLMNAAIGLRVNDSELTWLLSDVVLGKEKIDHYTEETIDKLVAKQIDVDTSSEFATAIEEIGLVLPEKGTTAAGDSDKRHLQEAAAKVATVVCAGREGKKTFTVRQRTIHKSLRHPLYRDEIAWLFNERGLTSLIQGRIFDAIPLFKKARFIMSHRLTPTSDDKAFNAVERRINLNLAIAQLERGNIAQARGILADIERSSESLPLTTPSRLSDYARGYSGLCEHLGGSFEAAISAYREALEKFAERRELRAIGIFKRHLGDLHLANGDLEEAERHLKLAMNAASQAQQRDIWNIAQASYARLLIERDRHDEAESCIKNVHAYAENMGLYGLRAQALQMHATLQIAQGEHGPAADSAANAIALSACYGMRLRKLSALIVYGEIQLGRGQHEVGIHVLRDARTEAEKQGYQLKAAKAAEVLSRYDKVSRNAGD